MAADDPTTDPATGSTIDGEPTERWCSVHDSPVDNDNGLCLALLFDPSVPDDPACAAFDRPAAAPDR